MCKSGRALTVETLNQSKTTYNKATLVCSLFSKEGHGLMETSTQVIRDPIRSGAYTYTTVEFKARTQPDTEPHCLAKGECGVAADDSHPSARADNPSFLEAALFFLTGVEPGPTDTVTDQEIILQRYPIVAYVVDGKPCAVRIRNTTDNQIWHMDFCKLVIGPPAMKQSDDGRKSA